MLEYIEKLRIVCGVILFKGEPLIDRMTKRAPVRIKENQNALTRLTSAQDLFD